MKRPFGCRHIAAGWLALQFVALTAGARTTTGAVKKVPRDTLYDLASRAANERVWPSLRRYAASSKDAERRGLAYFALGYREYDAGEFGPASADLHQATRVVFFLEDFAEYYEGAAALKSNQPSHAAEVLTGFTARYLKSTLKYEALAVLVQAYLQGNQPERAIQVLSAEPRVRQQPSLMLLLGQAYFKAQRWHEAAQVFQNIYYTFPTSPESKPAGQFVDKLRSQLGANLPPVSEKTETARAEELFNRSNYADAIREYETLLQAHPGSPFIATWAIGRARCLLRMQKFGDAVHAMESMATTYPDADAERLGTLVEAEARLEDSAGMARVLDQLSKLYPHSPSYASALSAAGNFFVRRGDWETAARYYEPLVRGFAGAEQALDADWRAAWSNYLEIQSKVERRELKAENNGAEREAIETEPAEHLKARQALVEHITRYPGSSHLPAALYWLGRLAEQRGKGPEARAWYRLLQTRFVHSYYTQQAVRRMAKLRAAPPASATMTASKIPPLAPPPAQVCASAGSAEVLRPFHELDALSLDGLADRYLRDVLSEHPSSPEVLYALSRYESKRGNNAAAVVHARQLVPEYPEYEFAALPKEVWKLLYPDTFWTLVQRQAKASGLDPYLVMGLIRQESTFNPHATSSADARGLMQILPSTGSSGLRGRRRQTAVEKLYDPAYNVRLGCRYLGRLIHEFGGNLEESVAAYHAGASRVKDWLGMRVYGEPAEFMESIPISTTRSYVEAVLRDAGVYRGIMTGAARFRKCG